MRTVSPFWRRPLAQGIAVFHVLWKTGVVTIAAAERVDFGFVQCHAKMLILIPRYGY
jgi:hypothetical protein